MDTLTYTCVHGCVKSVCGCTDHPKSALFYHMPAPGDFLFPLTVIFSVIVKFTSLLNLQAVTLITDLA